MCKILLSINPDHVENIFSGNKRYEFRKTKCKEAVDKIIIYSTAPIMEVVGEATVLSVLEGTPDSVWEKTKEKAGVDKIFFNKYYKGKEKAFAYKLGEVIKYDSPKKLSHFGVLVAPQSFVYLANS